MDDLISRKALKDELVKDLAKTIRLGEMLRVLNKIDDAPTVNTVEVVRCKECRRGFASKSTIEGHMYCTRWAQLVKVDGFCYMAQKEDRPPIVFRKYKPFEPDKVVTAEPDWSKACVPDEKDVLIALGETAKRYIKAVIAEAMNESNEQG